MSELGQRLIAIVRQKAAENSRFVYKPTWVGLCQYVHEDGAPGCLIGHALLEAGLIDASFYKRPDNTGAFFDLAEKLRLPIDQDEVDWLRNVQRRQDKDISWGDAVAYADDQAKRQVLTA